MNLSDSMKSLRERSNLSRKQIADQIGVSLSTYTNYEGGYRKPSIDLLPKIATALHVSIDDLLDYEPNKIAYFKLQIAQAGYTVEERENCFFVEDKEKTFRTSYSKIEFVAAMEGINDKVNESLKDIKAEVLRLQMYESFCHKYKGEDLTIVTPRDTI